MAVRVNGSGPPPMALPYHRNSLALAASMSVAAAAGTWFVRGGAAPIETGVQWWHVAVVVAFVERFAVRVQFRRQVQSISLGEAVLVLALMCTSPLGVVTGRAIGGILALVARRVRGFKLVFNGARFWMEGAVAAGLVQWWASGRAADTTWLLSAVAVIVGSALATAAVSAVIAFEDSSRQGGLLASMSRSQLILTVGVTTLTTLGGVAVRAQPLNGVLVVVFLVAANVALRDHIEVKQRLADRETAQSFTTALERLTDPDEVAVTALAEAARLLRAQRGWMLRPDPDRAGSEMLVWADDQIVTRPTTDAVRALVGRPGRAELVRTTAEQLDGHATPGQRMVALAATVAPSGLAFVLGDRHGPAAFDAADREQFEILAQHTGIALAKALAMEQLDHEASHDSLTGLYNRDGLARAIRQRDGEALVEGALLVFDVDRFQMINDTLGHGHGDRVLSELSNRVRLVAPPKAAVCRLGGDEFAVFLPGATPDGAARVAADLHEALRRTMTIESVTLEVTASIGIARTDDEFTGGHDMNDPFHRLLSGADIAMYHAKRNHLGTAHYSPTIDNHSLRQLGMLVELRRAVEDRKLQVWYQPKVDVSSGRIVGAEALVRWIHPDFGFVPPDEFISACETTGLIRDLTELVLSIAFDDTKRWQADGHPVPVAVNLSARNLLETDLAERICRLADEAEVPRDLVSFEITETAVMDDRERVAAILEELRDAGFRIAIDDYGTGQSSLRYLRDLPVDTLKIDRAFIDRIDESPALQTIVASTVDLAAKLGLQVVAEGIERPEELHVLQRFGCDMAQGYLFSRPVKAAEFAEWRDVWLAGAADEHFADRLV